MTAQARASLNVVDTFLAQQNTKLKELEKVQNLLLADKNADEAKININKNSIAAVRNSIETFQVKRADLIKLYPMLEQKQTVLDKLYNMFAKKPVITSVSPVKKQPSTEEFNLGDTANSNSPRSNTNSFKDSNEDASENTSLMQHTIRFS